MAGKATHDLEEIRGQVLDFSRENSLLAQIQPGETFQTNCSIEHLKISRSVPSWLSP
jgi:hypothetical protein